MALKGDINPVQTNIDFFLNETAERGLFLVYSTAGSGAAMDDSAALATVTTSPSGKVVLGVLLNDMVNLDLTRQHINWHKDEVQKGGKVTILNKGWVVTNAVSGTPTAGQTAYLAQDGKASPTQLNTGCPVVGVFRSIKDANGYAKIDINLP